MLLRKFFLFLKFRFIKFEKCFTNQNNLNQNELLIVIKGSSNSSPTLEAFIQQSYLCRINKTKPPVAGDIDRYIPLPS